ncbi:hypothetical protein QYM36_003190 [Artemia franciscana]|uniref:Uncharacterized protein n=1 Tax=Artemia franciscana TaxID=6661 RepID=A0AA88L908_ARTSF|nr:hypothetical protein QYM36_003190 [Artemia franciscana]
MNHPLKRMMESSIPRGYLYTMAKHRSLKTLFIAFIGLYCFEREPSFEENDGVVNTQTGPKDIAELWRDHYSAVFSSVASDPKAARARSFSKPWTDPVKQLITAESVAGSLLGLSGSKSGGIDGVTANYIKHSGPSLICLLTLLFNGFLNRSYIPDSLTQVCLVPILKSNTTDLASLSKYRPIALAAAISKLFEKCLYSLISPQIGSSHINLGSKKNLRRSSACLSLNL